MNRVGLPLEMYDHFGRFRTAEIVLHPEATATNVDAKGKHLGNVMREAPLDASGGFEFTLDPNLKGDVKNAVEFLHQMAESEAVEQVFVRHAFRYWMGRNETLGDAASLQKAHQAYRESDGSMKALIVSLAMPSREFHWVPAACCCRRSFAPGRTSSRRERAAKAVRVCHRKQWIHDTTSGA